MKIRGHQLICILGFRGIGYSSEYVLNMRRIIRRLRSPRSIHLEVVDSLDDICTPCSFFADGGCRQKGLHSEDIVKSMDFNVMARLGLSSGERMTWVDVESKIRSNWSPEDIDVICKDCQWLPLGYCSEGLKGLIRNR